MKKRWISALLTLTLLLTGCGASGGRTRELMAKIKPQKVEPAPMQRPAGSIYDFTVQLLQRCATERNTLVSPVSVLAALGMTANGATGQTLSQMEQVLGLPVGELNQVLYQTIASLPDEKGCRVRMANSVWLRDDPSLTVEQNFLQTAVDYYGAAVNTAPFDSSTVESINTWVKKHTGDMIDSVIQDIDAETMLYLINALSFDAEWAEVYDELQVRDRRFYCEDGPARMVEFLHSAENLYLKDENAQGVVKPYKGGRYAFAALLPEEGVSLRDYVAGLTGERLKAVLENAMEAEVITVIPKFETEYGTELSDILKAMGMTDAFDPDLADFSTMGRCDGDSLYISKVIHKTKIAVDERGTKAGAVTAVEMAPGADRPTSEPKKVILDRPFVYMLLDLETHTPLFLGTLMDPAG